MKIIIANIIALVASLIMVYYGTLKKKKKILFFQSIQIGLIVISDVILGGITGAIINFISLIRNIICYNNKLNLFAKLSITIISIILSVLFNDSGFIGYLPLISTVMYVWFMNTKDIKKFKLLIIIMTAMWFVYDFSIKAYILVIFDGAGILTNIISLIQINNEKNKKKRKNIKKKKK